MRRRAAVIVLVASALLLGCPADILEVAADGGVAPADARVDARVDAANACAPPNGDAVVPGDWKPPAPLHQNKCSDADLDALGPCFLGGATGRSCDAAAHQACFDCLTADGAVRGAEYAAPALSASFANVGGCLAAFDGNVGAGGCGAILHNAWTCSNAIACASCAPLDTTGALNAQAVCFQQSTAGACKGFWVAANDCMATVLARPGIDARVQSCVPGKFNRGLIELAKDVGRLFCGP